MTIWNDQKKLDAASMKKKKNVTFETIRRIAPEFPSAADGMSYGAPAIKVDGKLFIRWRKDLNAIVLKTTFEEWEAMIAEQPDVYFITATV